MAHPICKIVEEVAAPALRRTPIRCFFGLHSYPASPLNGEPFPLFWLVRCQHGCGAPTVRRNWID